jgi:hypothetical protein
LASAIEGECSNGVVVLPRLLQTPPVDTVPHDDITIAAACCKGAESRVKCYCIDRIYNVDILGLISNAVAFESVSERNNKR